MSRAETMKLVKALRKQKFTVERTSSGHWRVTSPDGTRSTTIAFSPRYSGFKAAERKVREIGFK